MPSWPLNLIAGDPTAADSTSTCCFLYVRADQSTLISASFQHELENIMCRLLNHACTQRRMRTKAKQRFIINHKGNDKRLVSMQMPRVGSCLRSPTPPQSREGQPSDQHSLWLKHHIFNLPYVKGRRGGNTQAMATINALWVLMSVNCFGRLTKITM